MRNRLCLTFAVLLLCSCRDKDSDPAERVTPATPPQAASQLEQSFAAAPPEVQSVAKAASQALVTTDYESAVQSLLMVKEQGNLTLDQGIAVHNSMISLEARLIAAAGAGDPQAKRAYEQFKKARRN